MFWMFSALLNFKALVDPTQNARKQLFWRLCYVHVAELHRLRRNRGYSQFNPQEDTVEMSSDAMLSELTCTRVH